MCVHYMTASDSLGPRVEAGELKRVLGRAVEAIIRKCSDGRRFCVPAILDWSLGGMDKRRTGSFGGR